MPRYIDADKAIDALTGWDTDPTDEEIKWTIDKIPTADVAEVKHGEWVETTEPLGYENVELVGCTACGETFITDEDCDIDYFKTFFSYCPNCGAKMDGGK